MAFLLRFSLHLGDSAGKFWGIPETKPEVWGLDAETGQVLWKWTPGVWKKGPFRGEYERLLVGSSRCVPNPVGNPTMDANGDVYIGMLDGFIYHLTRESSGPGVT